MSKGNIFVGFERLTTVQAKKLLTYSAEHKLNTVTDADDDVPTKGKSGDVPTKGKSGDVPTKGKSGDVIILPRTVTNAAKKYAEKFGIDAKKTVLNHFGAVTITGNRGLNKADYAQVLQVFKSDDEFQPQGITKGKDKKGKDKKGKSKKGKSKNKGK